MSALLSVSRFKACACAAVFMLAFMAGMANAATVTTNGYTYTYNVVNGGADITSGSSHTRAINPAPTGSFTIPSTLAGYPVTSIGDGAFLDCSGWTGDLTIPPGVTSIGYYAFYGCSKLTSVTIPSSVTSIRDGAFLDCSGWTGDLTIPPGVTSIGYYAFYGCSKLTSVTIPSSVTSIGNYAFYGCSGLTSVTIPSSITSIGYYAFYGCSGLTGNLTIPSGVTSIGNYAFSWCSGLTSVIIPSSVTSIGGYAFYYCYGLTGVTIPSSVTSIGQYAFSGTAIWYNHPVGVVYVDGWAVDWKGTQLTGQLTLNLGTRGIADSVFSGCSGLTGNLTIPSSVTSIGSSAFYGCSGLTGVTILSSVTSIGSSAFYGCSGLTGVTIPSSVTSIGSSAFYGCSGLTSVTIPSSVTYIGYSAFDGCSGLTSVTIPSSVTAIGSSAFSGCSGLTSVTIPSSVTYIENSTFSYCTNLTSVTIPSGIKIIGNNAFQNCTGLTGVTWAATNITSYPSYSSAFSGCTNLTSVTFSEGVTHIPAYAFYNVASLTSVTIPSSVTSIGNYAFQNCRGLTGVTWAATNITSYPSSSYHPFSGCTNLTSVTFSEGVTHIPALAFFGFSSLTGDLTIPSSVTYIGNNAFYNCRGLTGVTWAATNITSYPTSNIPFNGCTNLTSVTFSEGVTHIPAYAFYNCTGLTGVTIPSSVTYIGHYAFSNTAIFNTHPNGILYLDGWVFGWKGTEPSGQLDLNPGTRGIAGAAFANCSGLTSNLTIPSGVTAIGDYAFSGCSGLTGNLTIPSGVTSIGDYAFSGCSGLTGNLTIPSGVTSIGNGAFSGCIGLTSVTIPSSVTSIGEKAFNNCSGLTSATISEGVTLIRQEAFSDCYGLTSVTIPSSVTSIGNYAFQNCNVLTSVTWAATNVTSVSSSSHPFNGCTNLTSVTFSEDVTSIPAYAFYNVKSLTSVTIPSSVTSIGNQAFYDTAIWNNHPDGIVYIDGWAIDWKGTGPSGQLALNPGTRGIADRAFYNCSGLTGVTIPSGVTSIGQQAFQGCSGLTGNLTIPSGVTSIGSGAFYGCSGLTGVTIPSSVTSIGNQAFYDTAIWNNHPDDIVYIDGWAIGWKGTQPSGWLTLNPGTRGIADRGVSGCGGLTSVTIPSSVTSIGASAFSGCSKLTSVYFMGNAPSVVGKWIYDSSSISLTTYVLPYSTGWDGVAGSTALPALWNDRNIVCLAPVLDDVLKITDLPWEIGGDGDWLVQMVSTDSHVIRSGTIGDRESSWIETSVTGSGMFSFWWKVSSEIDDWLICTTNGVEALRISGEADWQQVSWMFGGGETVVRWTYAKDKSGVAGEDCGWLDGVAWIPYITVSFDAQGGSGVSPVVYDTKNAVYGELPETSRGGYGFEGWFASPSGGVAVTGSTPVGESSHTLYAQWSLLAPGGVTASQGTLRDKVLVGWSPVASAVSYSVYRSTGDDPAGAVCVDTVAGGTSYEDFGAEREVSYFYWVTSFDGSEESAFSAVAHGWREPLGLAEAVNGEGLAWTTGGDLPWLPQRDVTHDNEHAARSGAIEHSGMAGFYTTSWIETTVTGEGTLSFWWKVSSEEDYDWLSCFTNGVLALRISGEQDWAQVSIAITSEGETTVRWEYAKDKSDFEGQDCAWLDGVVWTPVPLYTSTPVPVPYSWLDQWQGGLVGSQAYEDFANSIGANGYTVWESYVAGLDPTDKDSIFRIRKFAVKNVNGTDTVTVLEWNPNYENDPPPLKRDYIIEGKTNLTDTAWHSPTNSGTRFFRVKAKLP